jgi:hypothetical protein
MTSEILTPEFLTKNAEENFEMVKIGLKFINRGTMCKKVMKNARVQFGQQ